MFSRKPLLNFGQVPKQTTFGVLEKERDLRTKTRFHYCYRRLHAGVCFIYFLGVFSGSGASPHGRVFERTAPRRARIWEKVVQGGASITPNTRPARISRKMLKRTAGIVTSKWGVGFDVELLDCETQLT